MEGILYFVCLESREEVLDKTFLRAASSDRRVVCKGYRRMEACDTDVERERRQGRGEKAERIVAGYVSRMKEELPCCLCSVC